VCGKGQSEATMKVEMMNAIKVVHVLTHAFISVRGQLSSFRIIFLFC
jgi:hypothetical protein